MRITGTFQTSAPLAPNLAAANIAPLITTFSFSDGLTTYQRANPQVRLFRAIATTNAAGVITALDFTLSHHLTATLQSHCDIPANCPPPTFNGVPPFDNPNTKIDILQIRSSTNLAYAHHNATCVAGASPRLAKPIHV